MQKTGTIAAVGILGAVCAFGLAARGEPAPAAAAPPVRVLLLSGRNNHACWRVTTPHLRAACEATGRFRVEVNEKPEALTAEALKAYDAILSNWNAFNAKDVAWPDAARQALIDFVFKEGKGFASVHAGSSSFTDWKEYQELVCTGWRVPQTGHGRVHDFPVTVAVPDHPVTRGLAGFTTHDELWHRAPLQDGVQVLATAMSSKESGGSGAAEPVAMVRTYGKGRSFNLLLGHDLKAMQNPGFLTLMTRGLEWAATGAVTLPAAAPTEPRR
jgi:type 1 glutamine amidotransferase